MRKIKDYSVDITGLIKRINNCNKKCAEGDSRIECIRIRQDDDLSFYYNHEDEEMNGNLIDILKKHIKAKNIEIIEF